MPRTQQELHDERVETCSVSNINISYIPESSHSYIDTWYVVILLLLLLQITN